MNVQTLAIEDVYKHMLTLEVGLSASEAAKRLHEYGFNEITEVRKTPLIIRFLSQFTHFLAILLWLAAALCFVSEYLRPGEGLLSLGLAIIAVIVINAVFTFVQEYRAEKAVAALKALLPFNAKVRRDGVEQEIPAREVVPGDVILLAEGDKVPADARLVAATRLMVNNAPLTGESDPKPRSAAPFQGDYLDSPNLVFAGTLVVSGKGTAVAVATGMATEFGKIAHLTSAVEPGLTSLQREIIRVTRLVAVIALTLGAVFFALGFFLGRSFWHNFLFAIGIIVANVPEGLLPTVTLSLAMASQRLARKKALIKNLSSVETLGSVTVICTDKTGTLTQNRMEVRRLWVPAGANQVVAEGMLLKIAGLCNNAVFTGNGYRGDPTEVALLKAARERGVDLTGERWQELPFDAERKRMTTVTSTADGVLVLTKGALETVLPLCAEVFSGTDGEALREDTRDEIISASQALMDEGLRVMAFAYKKLPAPSHVPEASELPEEFLESALTFVGLAGLEDPPRPEVPGAVRSCREAGIRVLMITGDAGRTALAVAREIGLMHGNARVVEGQELEKMSDRQLREVLSDPELLFARMTPRHKMRIVFILKKEGERVAVTGDGVNDAPALRWADIGVAMGLIGTDVAREAADMVLLDDNFATIVAAIEEGRAVFENIQKFMSYIFASNIAEIVPYLAYVLFNIPLPLTIMQILAVDLGTNMFPALALGADPPSPEVLRRPPRSPDEKLLNLRLLGRSHLFLGPIEAAAGLFGFFYVLKSGGWQWGETLPPHNFLYLQATTACLAAIVVTQIANVFACRSFRTSVFRLGLFSNRLILVGITLELLTILFIVYHPGGQFVFGTAPLPGRVWLIFIPFALALLFLEEGRKLLVRSWAAFRR
jgi:sodium/potassium-transporting ATPase subunit alpha